MTTRSLAFPIDRRIAAPPLEERLLNVILCLVIQMGIWLNFVTLALMLANAVGILSLSWWFVFLPALGSVAFGVVLLIAAYGIAALCQWSQLSKLA